MKSGQMFWGFFLLTLGALFLFTKYDLLQSSFDFVWNIWPLFFVFWGAVVMFKHTMVKPIVSGLFGVFLALLIFGIFYNTVWGFDYYDDGNDGNSESYVEDYTPNIKSASLEINAGAGKFIIKDTTNKLVDGHSYGSLADYDFWTDKSDSTANISFSLNKHDGNFFRGRFKNQLVLALNTKPVWDISFNIGASKSNYDLSPYKVANVELHTGATNTHIKLGDKQESTDVHIEMGAASATIEIPKTSGCSITGDMVLMSKNFPGFTKKDSQNYETENFNSSTKKVNITIDAGVSAIKVVRY